MDTNQIYQDIQGLHDLIYKINKRDTEAVAELNRLYRIVYGDTVTAGCGGCHIKAFRKLTDLSIEDLNNMENQDFKIKKGILVEYPFRSGQFFSAALGVSNELAIEYLTAHPSKIDQFEVYPGSESESKELDLSSLSKEGKSLDKMNKVELQAKYNEVLSADADESLTKKELIEAINAVKR